MSTSIATHCPDCKAELGAQSRICAQCGADVGLWPESQRTPLILPGNPALSADVVRKRTSIPKIVAGTTVVAAVLGAVLYYMPERETEDLPPVGVSAPASDSASVTASLTPPPVVVPQVAPLAAAPVVPVPEPSVPESLAAYSYGDTALARSVPSSPTVRRADMTPGARPAATVASRVPAPAPKPVTPPASRAAGRTPAPAATRAPRVATTAAAKTAKPAARPVATPTGTLTVTPLVSTTLKPGERLQLRWAVLDRSTKRPIPRARAEFTSTDETVADVGATTGLVVARTPGTVRIIVDAGTAGRNTMTLTVRAPAPAPAPSTQIAAASTEATRPPATTPATPAPTPPPAPAAVREAPRADMPDATEVRTVVDRFIRDVRRDGARNAALAQFLADGADHRVILVAGPNIVSTTSQGVRVAFDLRFTKFDGGGRPVTRVASVSMDVDKRDGSASPSAIAIGALRRP